MHLRNVELPAGNPEVCIFSQLVHELLCGPAGQDQQYVIHVRSKHSTGML